MVTSGLNQINPGWVCAESAYTICRGEVKFRDRRKAKHHGWYASHSVLRPSLIDVCLSALSRLRNVGATKKEFYTAKDIQGLGKNYVTHKDKERGIKAYEDVIMRYSLLGLLEVLERVGSASIPVRPEFTAFDYADTSRWGSMPWDEALDPSSIWTHQSNCLSLLVPDLRGKVIASSSAIARQLLDHLVLLFSSYAKGVKSSKSKDDYRGAQVLTFYKEVHEKASDDVVVRGVLKENEIIKKRVEGVLRGDKAVIKDSKL
jgi:hypothetical protein